MRRIVELFIAAHLPETERFSLWVQEESASLTHRYLGIFEEDWYVAKLKEKNVWGIRVSLYDRYSEKKFMEGYKILRDEEFKSLVESLTSWDDLRHYMNSFMEKK